MRQWREMSQQRSLLCEKVTYAQILRTIAGSWLHYGNFVLDFLRSFAATFEWASRLISGKGLRGAMEGGRTNASCLIFKRTQKSLGSDEQ